MKSLWPEWPPLLCPHPDQFPHDGQLSLAIEGLSFCPQKNGGCSGIQIRYQRRFLHEVQPEGNHKPRKKKKKTRLFAPKRTAGIHQTLIWKRDYSHRSLCCESNCFCWEEKKKNYPLFQETMLPHGKKSISRSSCCVGTPAAQVPKLGLPSPPWDPCKRSAHTFQVQPELLRAQSSVAGAPGHRS